jgi:ribosomal protein L40E
VRKRVAPKDPDYFVLGRVVHQALYYLADYPVEENIDNCVDKAVRSEIQSIPTIELVEKAKRLLHGWFTEDKFRGEILGKELKVSLCLQCGSKLEIYAKNCSKCGSVFDGKQNTLRYDAIIDLAMKLAPGVVKIKDYKTGYFLYSKSDVRQSKQLLGYALVAVSLWPGTQRVVVSIDPITVGAEIEIELVPNQLVEYVDYLRSVQKATQAIGKPKANVGSHCSFCDFTHLCSDFNIWLKEELKVDTEKLDKENMVSILLSIQEAESKRKYWSGRERELKDWLLANLDKNMVSSFKYEDWSVSVVRATQTSYDVDVLFEAVKNVQQLKKMVKVDKVSVDRMLKSLPPEVSAVLLATASREPKTPYLKITKGGG